VPAVSFHAPQGFFAIGGGFEYPAVLGMSAAALALIDPGEWSMDAILRHRLNRPWMAAAALITSAGMSTALVRRRHRVLAARADAAQADTHSPDSARSPAPVPGSEWMDGQ